MAKTIILERTEQGWMAQMLVNGYPDPEIVRLFGTHILPTSYTRNALPAVVLPQIQRLNPDAVVMIVSYPAR